MAKRNLTTQEILDLARQQDGGGAETAASGDSTMDSSAATAESLAVESLAVESPSAVEAEAKAENASSAEKKPRPSSTKGILAAARAQAAGGAAAKAKKAPPAASTAGGVKPRPKSTKDILAAARGQTASGAVKSASGDKPAASGRVPSAARVSPAVVSDPAVVSGKGSRPSVQEMLRAVRGELPHSEEGAAQSVKPKLPPRPHRPSKMAGKGRGDPIPRRGFLAALASLVATPLALGWTSFAAASAAASLGIARFMMPNFLLQPPSKFKAGSLDDYPPDTVSTKWKSEFAVFLTNTVYEGEPMIYALSTVCTHLGCTPNWLEGELKFKCPCHGSGFYPNGVNFEGPAPRPLERYGISLDANRVLEVDKSVKFQEEKGQWSDPLSFVSTG